MTKESKNSGSEERTYYSRKLSFIDEFKPKTMRNDNRNGCFYEFTKIVKSNPELELLFRGNSGDYGKAIIYYRNNVVCSLYKSSRSAHVEINYDHLRYTEEYDKIIRDKYHRKLGFPIKSPTYKPSNKHPEDKTKGACGIGYVNVSDKERTFDALFVERLIVYRLDTLDDYFDKDLSDDYFRDTCKVDPTDRDKPNYLEKENQQKYFTNNNKLKNGLFVYDLEYKRPFKDKAEKEKKLEEMLKKKIKSFNKPDCLAIRFDNQGNAISFVMIEIKSNPDAELGESGTEDHLIKMLYDLKDADFVRDRIKEAEEIIRDYQAIGLRGIPKNYTIPSFGGKKLEREILIVYTDDAAEKHKDEFPIPPEDHDGVMVYYELFE